MKLFLLRGNWFNSKIALVFAENAQTAADLVDQIEVLNPWSASYLVVLEVEINTETEAGFQGWVQRDKQTSPPQRTNPLFLAQAIAPFLKDKETP